MSDTFLFPAAFELKFDLFFIPLPTLMAAEIILEAPICQLGCIWDSRRHLGK